MAPSGVEELPASDFDLLSRLWEDEPWGPWRDNLHFSMLIREVLRAGGFRPPKVDAFMLRNPNVGVKEGRKMKANVFSFMKTMAVRKKRGDAEAAPAKAKTKAKKERK